MRYIAASLLAFLITNISIAQQFGPVDEGSEVGFKVRNFGINVKGDFKGLKGAIVFSEDHLADARFEVTIEVSTINTGINQRNNHLLSASFFEVSKYPLMRFESIKITKSTSKDYLYMFGKLTIKDVTKEISFPFKVTPDNGDYIFAGELSLNRRDYHVGDNSLTMSDNVKVSLKVRAKAVK